MTDRIRIARMVAGVSLMAAWLAGDVVRAAETVDKADPANVCLRGTLTNCRIRFERDKKGHVAFIGGSITEMNGYRPMVCEILKRRFPGCEFTFTDAGISSTCSTTGAFRLQSDVLSKGPVDLFFVEFAVNDDQDAHHSPADCVRGMEGIVRQCQAHNPRMDIVITHFLNEASLADHQAKKTPIPVTAHEKVAERYGVSTIHLWREVAARIEAGSLTWKKFGGVHPAPYGNALCAGMIDDLMARAWAQPLPADAKPKDHPLPDPLDPLSYARGRFIDPAKAKVKEGWTLGVPDWKSLKGSKRGRFTNIPMLWADKSGAELTLEFEGTAVGAYVVAGPDAGVLEVRVDDKPQNDVNLRHRFSAGLHYPRTVMFAADLAPGKHTLTLRVSEKSHGAGQAARIMQFTAN